MTFRISVTVFYYIADNSVRTVAGFNPPHGVRLLFPIFVGLFSMFPILVALDWLFSFGLFTSPCGLNIFLVIIVM